MNIGFLTSEYPPLSSGGIGTSIRNLAQALIKQGNKVTVIGWGAKAEFDDQGVKVRFLGHAKVAGMGWLLNRRLAWNELNRMFKYDGLEIVEAHDWCGVSAGMRLECPIVIRCHGMDAYFSYLLREKTRPSVYLAEWLALRHASSLAAVSHFTADITRKLFKLKADITVIPNGIDMNKFRPAESEKEEQGSILYLGTIVRKKGVIDLCQSFTKIIKHYPSARLWLAGRDAFDKKTGSSSTWALCRERLSSDALRRVEYFGAQPYDKVQNYINRASICAFPSYAEAMPLSWLEAMSCAKPVVAYDSLWAREIINHGLNGILTESGNVDKLADEILELLTNEKKRRLVSLAARKRIESEFRSDLIAKKTIEWYQQVIIKHKQNDKPQRNA